MSIQRSVRARNLSPDAFCNTPRSRFPCSARRCSWGRHCFPNRTQNCSKLLVDGISYFQPLHIEHLEEATNTEATPKRMLRRKKGAATKTSAGNQNATKTSRHEGWRLEGVCPEKFPELPTRTIVSTQMDANLSDHRNINIRLLF